MRSFTLVIVLLSLTTPQLQAGSLEKAYFAATQPGTWAKYESSWEMPDGMVGTNVYTFGNNRLVKNLFKRRIFLFFGAFLIYGSGFANGSFYC